MRLGEGNRDLAIRTKTKLINQGENEFMIFSMILGQMRNMIKVLQCQRKGIKSEQEISDETGNVHPFVVKKTIRQVQKFFLCKKLQNCLMRHRRSMLGQKWQVADE